MQTRVKRLLEVCPDEDFGTMLVNLPSEANLELDSAVFPSLFARMSPMLNYRKPSAKAKQLNKEAFKTFPNCIIENAKQLLAEARHMPARTDIGIEERGQLLWNLP